MSLKRAPTLFCPPPRPERAAREFFPEFVVSRLHDGGSLRPSLLDRVGRRLCGRVGHRVQWCRRRGLARHGGSFRGPRSRGGPTCRKAASDIRRAPPTSGRGPQSSGLADRGRQQPPPARRRFPLTGTLVALPAPAPRAGIARGTFRSTTCSRGAWACTRSSQLRTGTSPELDLLHGIDREAVAALEQFAAAARFQRSWSASGARSRGRQTIV